MGSIHVILAGVAELIGSPWLRTLIKLRLHVEFEFDAGFGIGARWKI
jgi:hypothetical protein